jgi:hypothetical protein
MNDDLKRLELAADNQLIQMLHGRYMFYLDEFAYDKIWDNLMAKDHPEISVEIEEMGRFAGPQKVKAFLRGLQRLAEVPVFGIMPVTSVSTPLIQFSPDGTRAKGYWHYWGGNARIGVEYPGSEEELVAFWTAGKFENEYIEVDGEWKILKIHQVNWMRTPYDQGWIKQADCVRNKVPGECIPDGPSRISTYRPDAKYTSFGPYNYGPHPTEDGSF